MVEEMMGNFKKYVFIMPFVGLFVSLLLFVYFFGITGVEGSTWAAVLYCALPFLINAILCLPLWIYFKVSKKRSIHRNEEHT
ncbi:membrane protein [Bacillus stratosphericus]|nr:membrane protein [Bacillus stratosphericus]KML59374.1 membrane protein [Bacillus stratosphericus]